MILVEVEARHSIPIYLCVFTHECKLTGTCRSSLWYG